MSKPSIAFVGIGAMGTPMAGRLAAAGYSVAVFDKDTAKAQALAQTHKVRLAASLADAAAGADIVITMLPDGAIVRSAVCGANDSFTDCLAAAMKPGALLIDMSSSQPMGTRALGKLLAARGLALLWLGLPAWLGLRLLVSSG